VPKTKPVTSPRRLEELRRKQERVNHKAFDTKDREETFQFAMRQGLKADQIAKLMAENFTIKGEYLNPNDYV